MEQAVDNMRFYNAYREVPENAKKTIEAGKLKGKTNINPQWRLRCLTEAYGPVGFGWKLQTVEHWTSEAAGEICANVKINLFVKDPKSGIWSDAIEGVGGSKLCGKGQGDGINDEAWKMATTDAISVACKMLGMGADVYWAEDRTKYDLQQPQQRQPQQRQQQQPQQQPQGQVYRRQLTNEDWNKFVIAAASGKPCKSGITAREGFIKTYGPTEELLAQFDCAVNATLQKMNNPVNQS